MDVWEFLLQQEGDQTWLPLESPVVEVLEGRYRLIARSGQVNTPAEIRVVYHAQSQAEAEHSSKPYLQKWHDQTDTGGVLAILPFSYLKPGLWEFRCIGDVLSDFLGKSWSYKVQLQVLARDYEVLEDWVDPDLDHQLATEAMTLSSPIGTPIPNPDKAALPSGDLTPSQPVPFITAIAPASLTEAIWADPATFLKEGSAIDQQATDHQLVSNLENADEHPGARTVEEPLPLEAALLNEPEVEVEPSSSTATHPVAAEMSANLEPIKPSASDFPNEIELVSSSDPALSPVEELLVRPEELADESERPQLASDLHPPVKAYLDYLAEVVDQVSDSVLEQMQLTSPNLSLRLEQETFAVSRGESIVLAGQIELEPLLSTALLSRPLQAELGIYLRDPQTNQLISGVRQPLPEQLLPISFSCVVEVPSHCNVHLILGEVILYADGTDPEAPVALATHSFSIAANFSEVIHEIWQRHYQGSAGEGQQFMAATAVNAPNSFSEAVAELQPTQGDRLNLNLFELVKNPTCVQPLQLVPLREWTVPPQICHSQTQPTRLKALQLPKLPRKTPVTQPGEKVYQPRATPCISGTTVAQLIPSTQIATQVLERLNQLVNGGMIGGSGETETKENTFQSLPLRQRFWTRLVAFASDTHTPATTESSPTALDEAQRPNEFQS